MDERSLCKISPKPKLGNLVVPTTAIWRIYVYHDVRRGVSSFQECPQNNQLARSLVSKRPTEYHVHLRIVAWLL